MSDNLPEEILIEILLKLPVKSLIRVTSVCKPCRSLIRSPSFISAHLSNSENQALLRRFDSHHGREHYTVSPKRVPMELGIRSWSEFEFPFNLPNDYFRIIGSCDGVICLYNLLKPCPPIIIWNRAIRNHVLLPQPLLNPNEAHLVVLGFGVAHNVYKVVRLVFCKKYNGAEVFSLGTGRWRKLSGFYVGICVLESTWCPIFFKGFMHWVGSEGTSKKSKRSARNSILTFHVGDEVFGETMLPEELERDAVTSLGIAIIGGESLAAIKCDGHIGNRRFDVWIRVGPDIFLARGRVREVGPF